MAKKPAPKANQKDDESRTDEARHVAEEYANDQRDMINKLRKPTN